MGAELLGASIGGLGTVRGDLTPCPPLHVVERGTRTTQRPSVIPSFIPSGGATAPSPRVNPRLGTVLTLRLLQDRNSWTAWRPSA